MFRGNSIEVIKPLTDEFTPTQMVSLWRESERNIGGSTPAHLGLQAVLDRVSDAERKLLLEKKLLKIVALISDGEYDDIGRVNRLVTRLRDMNVVVAEFPIQDALAVADLPQNVAGLVIESVKTLMPERVKE